MKMAWEQNEWWPVTEIEQSTDDETDLVDVPDELVARYNAALAEWNSVQKELDALIDQTPSVVAAREAREERYRLLMANGGLIVGPYVLAEKERQNKGT